MNLDDLIKAFCTGFKVAGCDYVSASFEPRNGGYVVKIAAASRMLPGSQVVLEGEGETPNRAAAASIRRLNEFACGKADIHLARMRRERRERGQD
jgi:hypothetical protein